jgi:hypothetical protein
MAVAMDRHLMAAPYQLPGQVGRAADLDAEAKEGGSPPEGIEGVQDGRGDLGVGPVIEGDGYVAGVAHS